MQVLKSGTRMLQTQQNIRDNTFTLFNTQIDKKIEINRFAAKLLRSLQSSFENRSYQNSIFSTLERIEFKNQLIDLGFISEVDEFDTDYAVYLASNCNDNFPLTNLNIELSDMCNLRCKHCYGSFSNKKNTKNISYELIKSSLSELNKMHTQSISLTGGEATIHPNFIDIAMFYLKNGFDLCVFSNGYNYKIIKKLLEVSKEYHYTFKLSVDGFRDIHDSIRGRANAYDNAMITLRSLMEYSNVTVYISTTLMKDNIHCMNDFDQFIKNEFPTAIHTTDLVFPYGNADQCTFSLDQLDDIIRIVPKMFRINQGTNTRKILKKDYRCSGGISQCTISPDGCLKICNSACADIFKFKYNAFSYGLSNSWNNCGKNIKKYRKEKVFATSNCKKCNNVSKCNRTDCRVLSYIYTGDEKRSNPLTCYLINNIVIES
jgi:MoaA/NifB/PqqE/SkfB family radical SAM enzyme